MTYNDPLPIFKQSEEDTGLGVRGRKVNLEFPFKSNLRRPQIVDCYNLSGLAMSKGSVVALASTWHADDFLQFGVPASNNDPAAIMILNADCAVADWTIASMYGILDALFVNTAGTVPGDQMMAMSGTCTCTKSATGTLGTFVGTIDGTHCRIRVPVAGGGVAASDPNKVDKVGETGSPTLYSGAKTSWYSDAGVTKKVEIDGTTGNIDNSAGTTTSGGIVAGTSGVVSAGDVKIKNGFDLIGYSDDLSTEKFRVDMATGNITSAAGATVDTVDISAHAHTGGAGQGAQVSHASLTNITATDHHSNANDPTSDQKAGLGGTPAGTGANPFITKDWPQGRVQVYEPQAMGTDGSGTLTEAANQLYGVRWTRKFSCSAGSTQTRIFYVNCMVEDGWQSWCSKSIRLNYTTSAGTGTTGFTIKVYDTGGTLRHTSALGQTTTFVPLDVAAASLAAGTWTAGSPFVVTITMAIDNGHTAELGSVEIHQNVKAGVAS